MYFRGHMLVFSLLNNFHFYQSRLSFSEANLLEGEYEEITHFYLEINLHFFWLCQVMDRFSLQLVLWWYSHMCKPQEWALRVRGLCPWWGNIINTSCCGRLAEFCDMSSANVPEGKRSNRSQEQNIKWNRTGMWFFTTTAKVNELKPFVCACVCLFVYVHLISLCHCASVYFCVYLHTFCLHYHFLS